MYKKKNLYPFYAFVILPLSVCFFVLVLFSSSNVQSANPVTVTFVPTADTQIYAQFTTENTGNATTAVVQQWSNPYAKRMLVKFNITSIPANAVITDAKLKLYQQGSHIGSAFVGAAHRLTRDWTEGTGVANSGATWARYNGVTNWTTAGGDFSATITDSKSLTGGGSGTLWSWNVTNDVTNFVNGSQQNYGWILKSTTENGAQRSHNFYTKEFATINLRPQLEITYTPGGTPPVVAVNSSVLQSNGTVQLSTTVSDVEANGVKMRVMYASKIGGTCGDDETFLNNALLNEDASSVSINEGTKPDVENDNQYQIGSVVPITTSNPSTLGFEWLARMDLPGVDGTYCLRFIAHDGTSDGNPVYTSVLIDNKSPTAPGSLSLNNRTEGALLFNLGSQSSDLNFLEYKVHYKAGSSGVNSSHAVITKADYTGLGQSSYGGLTNILIPSLAANTQYVANIFAYDAYTNEPTGAALEASYFTLANIPSTPLVNVAPSAVDSLVVVLETNSNPNYTVYAICELSGCAQNKYIGYGGNVVDGEAWQTYDEWGGVSGISVLGLESNTGYQFKVKARNGDGVETVFSPVSPTVFTHALAVSNVVVSNVSNDSLLQLSLVWQNNNNTGMKVEQDNDCDGLYDTIIFDNPSTNASLPFVIDGTVGDNRCYQYAITSYNVYGVLSSQSVVESNQITTPPGQVQNLVASLINENSVDWQWDVVEGADQYRVYSSAGSLLGVVDVPFYMQTDLNSNQQYSIFVRAESVTNGQGVSSAGASAYTSAFSPINLDYMNQSTESITWKWNNDGQSAFYAQDANNLSDNSDWTANTMWTQSGLLPNTKYTVEVKAKNESEVETGFSSISKYTFQEDPTGISFSDVSFDGMTVSADGTFLNQGVDSAYLFFDNGDGSTQRITEGVSWQNTSLIPNTTYSYSVYATNGDDDHTATTQRTQTTRAITPGTISVLAMSSSALQLTLDANTNPLSTNVAVYEPSQNFYVDASTKQLDALIASYASFSDWGTVVLDGMSPNTAYSFASVAKNEDEIETDLSSVSSLVYTLANIPQAPIMHTITPDSITLQIEEGENPAETQYAIYESTLGKYVDGAYALSSDDPIWQTTSSWGNIVVQSLTPNTHYSFLLVAKNGDDVFTDSSVESSVHTLAREPNIISTRADSQQQITLIWGVQDNPLGTEYNAYNITKGESSGWNVSQAWSSNNLICGTTYSFHVRSRNLTNNETIPQAPFFMSTFGCPIEDNPSGGSGTTYVLPTPSSGEFSFSINNNATSTGNSSVILLLGGGESAEEMHVSEDPTFTNVSKKPYTSQSTFTLSGGNGIKTIYVKFYSSSGAVSPLLSHSIELIFEQEDVVEVETELPFSIEESLEETEPVLLVEENHVLSTVEEKFVGEEIPINSLYSQKNKLEEYAPDDTFFKEDGEEQVSKQEGESKLKTDEGVHVEQNIVEESASVSEEKKTVLLWLIATLFLFIFGLFWAKRYFVK